MNSLTFIKLMAFVLPISSTFHNIASAQNVTISGSVHYKSGAPVNGALVDVYPLTAVGGILPAPVFSDRLGHYTINYPAVGTAEISASKENEGFPNLALALYGSEALSLKLDPGLHLDHVDFTLSAPCPVVRFEIIDELSRKPLGSARFYAQLEGNKGAMISRSVSDSGIFLFPVPHHATSVVISAPGHQEWKKTFLPSVPMKEAENNESTLSVALHPDAGKQ